MDFSLPNILPYDIYTKLYNANIVKSLRCCHLDVRSCSFIGTVPGEYAPNVAVQGDMGWKPTEVELLKSLNNQWL